MAQQITLQEAVKMVPNMSTIFIGGFAHVRACMAFSREMIRQKKHDMYFVSSGPTVHVDLLAAGRVITKMEVRIAGLRRLGRRQMCGGGLRKAICRWRIIRT